MHDSLAFIYKEQKELALLGGISALLGWDQMTYMPPKGIADRSEQHALLSRLMHERVVSDTFYNHITTLSEAGVNRTLAAHEQLMIARLRKDVEKARKVPPAFTEKLSKATTLAYKAWEEARAANHFKGFAPHLEEIIGLERQYCDYIKLPGPMYNSLLDDYEEGMTVDILKREFAVLRRDLTTMIGEITASPVYERQKPFDRPLSVATQRELSTRVLAALTLPTDETRLDVSTHPFTTTLADEDVRITTSYERPSPLFSFFSTVHEAGHALYELGLPKGAYRDTVLSDAPSLGLHESQSRFWENMICRSRSFWQHFFPVMQDVAGESLAGIGLDAWYRSINQVHPSLIRVEADELTYCLHVILRFELECALIDGKVSVDELPTAWNDKMQDFLGITPPTDRDGVLQDMHWSGGDFGYFPTYAIGSIYAAQLYRALAAATHDLDSTLSSGDLSAVLGWLRTNVHEFGRRLTADEIIRKACGEGLNVTPYVTYLKTKYYPLYDI